MIHQVPNLNYVKTILTLKYACCILPSSTKVGQEGTMTAKSERRQTVSAINTVPSQNDPKGNTKRCPPPADRKVIKIFVSITILFTLSFIPSILHLTRAVKYFPMIYAYFINHFTNPIIYYVIDINVRNDMNALFRKFKFW